MENELRIIRLQAQNIKKLVAVDISPDGAVVQITGRNGAGKSSTLDAIMFALGGERGIQAQPIREGESKARIRVDLGDIVVERRFTEKGSTLVVANKDGARFGSPQKMLDALVGRLSFDPLEFTRMDPKKRYETLRGVVAMDGDIDALDLERSALYEKRRGVNRAAKELAAAAENVQVPKDAPDALVSADTLVQQVNDAMEVNRANAAKRAEVTQQEKDLQFARDRVVEMQLALKRAEEKLSGMEEAFRLAVNATTELVDADVDVIRSQLRDVESQNDAARKKKEHQKKAEDAALMAGEAAKMTERMEAIDAEKVRIMASAKFPVPGLGFHEGTVTLDGIPFSQASSAQQLRVSVGISMAANPKLRIILISDASLLDSESMKIIAEMAKNERYQVWCEQVDETGRVGVFIEEGRVAAVNGVPTKKVVTPPAKGVAHE